MSPADSTPALELDGIGMEFGGVQAVKDVSLTVAAGECRAIIGPNGAGKTTLFHVIGGQLRPTRGTVRMSGTDITRVRARGRVRLGLARSFQVVNLFFELSVRDNVLLALRGTGARGGDDADSLLAEWGLESVADMPVESISYGSQRELEIVLALSSRPQLLLLDEPTSGLPTMAARDILEKLGRLRSTLTMILVEHDMDVVAELADTVTVMNEGSVLTTGPTAQVMADPQVREVYLGEELVGGA